MLIACTAQAQQAPLDLPANYQFKTIEDYQVYRQDAYNAMQWMIEQPLSTSDKEWELASAFIMQYVQGSPDVSIMLKDIYLEGILKDKDPLISKNLIIPYISAMAMTQLKFPKADAIMVQNNGFQVMLRAYESIRKNHKNKFMEKIRRLNRKGDLYLWLKEHEQA
ncbi:hypothetical protein PEPS_07080 [Persicobacter psychrovividus]|uniref:Sel1 repeat family protein n=2 Tax=Persicobacter psychrovividus TaxID=387638 RepID=A0ABN6L5J8_9BACT|nr:hypothetical protein PEPS_07080 [Persicobacter psychrovividus]